MGDSNLPYLNIGCGAVFHPSWTNVDLVSNSQSVKIHNIKKGLPFADESFEVIYHSHVLEHLDASEVNFFLSEIKRVLKPGGIHRIVVPDLEQMTRAYLSALEQNDSLKHEWMILELLDQLTRKKSGGLMAEVIVKTSASQREFIKSRIGSEAEILWTRRSHSTPFRIRSPLKVFRRIQKYIAEGLIFLIGGPSLLRAFREGVFRQSGEVHRWAYDRLNLKASLGLAGFKNFSVKNPFESEIPNYKSFELDAVQDKARKPDSIFVECRKGS